MDCSSNLGFFDDLNVLFLPFCFGLKASGPTILKSLTHLAFNGGLIIST